jgi:UDPglucose 6-dehydrogenase
MNISEIIKSLKIDKSKSINISIIGAGYVGIPTGCGLASFDHNVNICDLDERKISILKSSKSPIYEDGLDDLLSHVHKNMSFSTDVSSISNADAVIIAVGTPNIEGTNETDLKYIEGAIKNIATHCRENAIIITKSTVPVGTSHKMEELFRSISSKKVHFVSNPEFLKEGCALEDFFNPDRVVLGLDSDFARDIMSKIYYMFADKILFTDRRSSELIKCAANAFLATKISFINEISRLCEKVDANIMDVAKGIGMDKRIGSAFLNTGPGWGGSCFPKDTDSLVNIATKNDTQLDVVNAAIKSNYIQKDYIINRTLSIAHKNGIKTVGIIGLAFKSGTDDIRDSVAIQIIKRLLEAEISVISYDPEAMENTKAIFSDKIIYAESMKDVMKNSDMSIIMTEWSEFKNCNPSDIKSYLGEKMLIDYRNIFNKDIMKSHKIKYTMLGVGNV